MRNPGNPVFKIIKGLFKKKVLTKKVKFLMCLSKKAASLQGFSKPGFPGFLDLHPRLSCPSGSQLGVTVTPLGEWVS